MRGLAVLEKRFGATGQWTHGRTSGPRPGRRAGSRALALLLCASILSGCTHAQAQQGANSADAVATGGGLILLLGAAVVVGTAALIVGAIQNAQEDESQSSTPPLPAGGQVTDGTYSAANDDWSIRMAVSGSRFHGDAFCKRTRTPVSFSGTIADDGAVEGIGQARAYHFYGMSLAPFAVGGRWPAIELDTKGACGPSVVPLQST
jgi:hypothetical protein